MTEHQAIRDALSERLVEACIGALDLLNIYVGDQLRLYPVLADTDPLTAAEFAARCGIAPRYAQEWLEQQTIAGILTTTDDTDAASRRYRLPTGHAEVLTDTDSLAFMAPLAQGLVGVARALPQVLDAFRTGGGVQFSAYGEELRSFIARINRPMFVNQLAQDWFPKIPDLVARLNATPPARIADIGCGSGWSTITIALAYPLVSVTGIDLDDASVAEARKNAAAAGVADRVTFHIGDAAESQLDGTFDLVCAFETIHDMNDPTAALAAMRALRAPGGIVVVADERVADQFSVEVDPGERFQWGWSALHCLPTALTAPPAAGTGTIMRTPTLRRYAQAAGFSDIEVLPIDNDFWRFYRLLG
jgi:SAM-dependent methyltransferase